MSPAEIKGILEQFAIVRPDVEQNRQRSGWMDSGAKRIERKFTDRDSHTPDTEITETKNSFPISHYYYFRVLRRCVIEQRKDLVTIWIGNIKTAWTAKHVTV